MRILRWLVPLALVVCVGCARSETLFAERCYDKAGALRFDSGWKESIRKVRDSQSTESRAIAHREGWYCGLDVRRVPAR